MDTASNSSLAENDPREPVKMTLNLDPELKARAIGAARDSNLTLTRWVELAIADRLARGLAAGNPVPTTANPAGAAWALSPIAQLRMLRAVLELHAALPDLIDLTSRSVTLSRIHLRRTITDPADLEATRTTVQTDVSEMSHDIVNDVIRVVDERLAELGIGVPPPAENSHEPS
jgi:hypothetical protein